jgi:hypothetical protein
VAKEPVTGEHVIGVKTIAQGKPDQFGEPVVTMLVCFLFSHARLRVHWAPGFPCALCFQRRRKICTTRAHFAPRDRGFTWSNVIASEAKKSILSLRRDMDCFAALAMTVSTNFAV